ncbi:hypothetical protein B4U80_04886, partial [Leptotrombidium deliense]
VGWVTPEEVITCGDDHKLIFWNALSNEAIKTIDLPQTLFPTDLHCFPKSVGTGRQKQVISELFVVSATDGNFYIFNRSGNIEKAVEAHRGAVLTVRWSTEGSALASGGEDGQLKIWSKSGMLRSTVSAHPISVYALCWSPNSDHIVYTIESRLEIKPLSPNAKPIQWKGHDGVILRVAWNQNNNLIVSGAEDCRYKVWDSLGRLLYASASHDYPITSLAWSPDGSLFAVGSFNTLKLCDKTGWSYSLEKPQTQSILNLCWSTDSTQVAGVSSSGTTLFSYVVDRVIDWKAFEVIASGRKLIKVKNVTTTTEEEYDFRENIIKLSMEFGHLLVITTTQCHVYKVTNFNTPHTLDLKDPNITLLLQSDRNFLLVDALNVNLYSYEGRLLIALKWIGLRIDSLNKSTLALSGDSVAARDSGDFKVIHFIDTQTGKEISNDNKPFKHKLEINIISMNYCETPNDRICAFADKNTDLYLTLVRASNLVMLRTVKCTSMVASIIWSHDSNILAAIQENGKLQIWLYPQTAFVDKQLLSVAAFEKDSVDMVNKNPQLISFWNNRINVRRCDGSLVAVPINPFANFLHTFVSQKRWNEALRLCRYLKDNPDAQPIWAAFAGMALHGRQLEMAEVAYAEIDKLDKVFYIQKIQKLTNKDARNAEIALIAGNVREAENILLVAGYVLRAIMLNIDLYYWEKALDLAMKYNKNNYIDIVLYYRQQFLERFDKSEDSQKFMKFFAERTVTENFDISNFEQVLKDQYSEKIENTSKGSYGKK